VFVGEGGIIRDGVVTQPDRNQKLRSPMWHWPQKSLTSLVPFTKIKGQILPKVPELFRYGTYPNWLLSNGYRGPFPGGKARPGRDADHSPPSSAEVKNE
jgi:hypothetical protein